MSNWKPSQPEFELPSHLRPAYEAFVAPARATVELWRLVFGLISLGGIYFAGLIGTIVVYLMIQGGPDLLADMQSFADTPTPWGMIVTLFSFGWAWVGTAIALRVWHGRKLPSAIGRAPIVLRDFVTGFFILSILGVGLSLLLIMPFRDAEIGMDLSVWLRFLPLALVGLLIQTGAEEVVFRGYFQTQLAARFRSRFVFLVVPSIFFGLAHLSEGMTPIMSILIVLATGAFGLIAADLTRVTGSIGFAWGMHFANNIFALLVIGAYNSGNNLGGLALLRVPQEHATPEALIQLILTDIAITFAIWVAARLWVRRR